MAKITSVGDLKITYAGHELTSAPLEDINFSPNRELGPVEFTIPMDRWYAPQYVRLQDEFAALEFRGILQQCNPRFQVHATQYPETWWIQLTIDAPDVYPPFDVVPVCCAEHVTQKRLDDHGVAGYARCAINRMLLHEIDEGIWKPGDAAPVFDPHR